jgi:hypothetical protein
MMVQLWVPEQLEVLEELVQQVVEVGLVQMVLQSCQKME